LKLFYFFIYLDIQALLTGLLQLTIPIYYIHTLLCYWPTLHAPKRILNAPGVSPYATGFILNAPGRTSHTYSLPPHAPSYPPYAPGHPPYAPGRPPYAPGCPPYSPGSALHFPGYAPDNPGPYPVDTINNRGNGEFRLQWFSM